ncbi:MAG: GNAT family N-acetyltransferase [Jhaorihella sp.]
MRQGVFPLTLGRYCARLAAGAADLAEAQALRALAFATTDPDRDRFDDLCQHVLVRERAGGSLVCCFRLLMLADGGGIGRSYSAQFYDLSALGRYSGSMAELGRFCVRPGHGDPDILRLAWASLTACVDAGRVAMLFGCSSFAGTSPEPYLDSFALLAARHLAPDRWRPRVRADDVFNFAEQPRRDPDMRRAMLWMPPLLRSYLAVGGWVSDHAVVDRHLNTLHVFTGLETAAIPALRQRRLRAVACAGGAIPATSEAPPGDAIRGLCEDGR